MDNGEKKHSLFRRLFADLNVDDKEDLYRRLKAYLCTRFNLEESACNTDDILELAEISLEKKEEGTLEEQSSDEDASNLCSGASSALSKKILFLLSIEKNLHIDFLPEEIPNIKTIRDLSEYVSKKIKNISENTNLNKSISFLYESSSTYKKEECLNIEKIRSDFPILQKTIGGKPFIYLDNAATTQIPNVVIQTMNEFYLNYNANVHRSLHTLNRKTTALLEETREKIQRFINASDPTEIIFTKGATESINMVAKGLGDVLIEQGDEIVVTEMEHHSNLIPWQILCKKKKAILRIIPFDQRGNLIIDEFERSLSEKTKIIAITHVSNVLGTLNPIKKITEIAHTKGIFVIVDGAQSIRHGIVNVDELDCDFLCFSGHKMMAPSGTGVLYGKRKWLDKIQPFLYGGGMILDATLYDATFKESPYKFEAGTYNTGGIIALGTAVTFLEKIGFENIQKYEKALIDYLLKKLSSIEGLKLIGSPDERIGVVSFIVENIHSDDIAISLDQMGIAVRSGHHCAIPVLKHYNIESCVRVSPAFYNTFSEVDAFIDALKGILKITKK